MPLGTGGLVVALVLVLGGVGPATPASSSCPDVAPTLVGTAGDDELVGTPGDDVIAALGGDDTVRGRGGHDVICGGAGTDRLVGGAGDDELHGEANGLQQRHEDSPPDNVGDTLVPGPGDDHVDPGRDTETDAGGGWMPDHVSFAGSVAPVHVDLAAGTVTGEGADTIVVEGTVSVLGSAYDDVLSGTDHADDLLGGEGRDVLHGLAGDDLLRADPDTYRLDRPGWGDEAYGGPGNDSLLLGNGDDLGRGGLGRDSLVHGSGLTDLLGGPGRDYLETYLELADGQQVLGGAGRDVLYAWSVVSAGGEPLEVRGSIDLPARRLRMVSGDEVHTSVLGGAETLRVPNGRWRLRGTAHDERLFGPELDGSRLVVRAGAGDDVIGDTPGDDRIHGGPGTDRVSQSFGRDVCTSIERWYDGDRCEVVR